MRQKQPAVKIFEQEMRGQPCKSNVQLVLLDAKKAFTDLVECTLTGWNPILDTINLNDGLCHLEIVKQEANAPLQGPSRMRKR